MTCCGHTGLTRFLRTERRWFTPTHDAVLLKKAFKVGAWAEIDTSGQISVAVYPAGAYTASTLQTAVRTLSAAGSNNLDCSSSDVTDPGFELV